MKANKLLLLGCWCLGLAFMGSCSDDDAPEVEEKTEIKCKESNSLVLADQMSFIGPGDDLGTDFIETNNGFIICGINENEAPYLLGVDSNFQVLWQQNLGISGVGGFEKIIRTSDGNFVAAGFTEVTMEDLDLDLYVVKIDALGNLLWEKNLGIRYVTDTTIDLVESSNGDLIIAGSKLTEPVPDNILAVRTDIIVVKTDSQANVLWSQTFGDTGNETLSSIVEESNGNILIGGSQSLENPNTSNQFLATDVLIIETDNNGQYIQEKTFGSSENDGAPYLHLLDAGQIAVVASSSGSDQDVTSPNMGGSDVWIFILNSTLDIINQISIGDTGQDTLSQLVQKEGEFLLVGSTDVCADTSSFSDFSDLWIVKLSSSLTLLDELVIGGSQSDSAEGLIIQDDTIFVLGNTLSDDGNVEANNGSFDIWLTLIEDLD